MFKRVIKSFCAENISTGYLYFYVHFITEICCFFCLTKVTGDPIVLWFTPFIYDFAAFVPQSVIGLFCDNHPKFKPGIVGTIVLSIGMLLFYLFEDPYVPILVVAIGNAFIHVSGAETTLRTSHGKLSHVAIFVAGGSFGVISGKMMAALDIPMYALVIAAFTMIPFILLADKSAKDEVLADFNYANKSASPLAVVLFATLIVMIRGYMGYGIPTSWNKTAVQAVLLYVTMGIGKAMGGILSDAIGMRKTMFISILGALPFLLFGDKIMIVSLIGVMFFSMTMSISLGLIVSALKENPGLSFGFTTIGLFLGTVPIFIFRVKSLWINIVSITVMTMVCLALALHIIGKERQDARNTDGIS